MDAMEWTMTDFTSEDFTSIPSPNFDTLPEPSSLFFDFDSFADGPVPDATTTTTTTDEAQLPSQALEPALDFESLFGVDENAAAVPFPSTISPFDASDAIPLPLVLPGDALPESVQPSSSAFSPDKDFCSADDFDSFLAQLADADPSPQTAPAPAAAVAPQEILPLPLETWPVDEVSNDSFGWFNPSLDFPPVEDDLFAGFKTKPDLPSVKEAQPTAQPGPLTFFPDLTLPDSIPFDVEPYLTPQPLAQQAIPLEHPQPINPALPSPSFIQDPFTPEQPSASLAPSSIIDSQGHVKPPLSVSPTPPRDLSTPIVDGKLLKRIPRPAKAKDVNADAWYDPLPAAPAPWGGPDPSRPLFAYTPAGEWRPGQRLSRDDILHYLTERKRLSLPLTLWIQNLPHGCVRRVPDPRTLKCRWSGCPAQNGTILKGFWRVCFDERPSTSGREHNPFHNAGYLHLWCLDRCFDLHEIAEAFDLRPDTRRFEKEERNPMAMTRDHDELVLEFERWRDAQRAAYADWRALCQQNESLGLPTPNRVVPKEQKLWHILTTKHLQLETVVRQAMRDNRQGISIDQHRGDLGWYCKKVNERKRLAKARKDGSSRRLAGVSDDEDDDGTEAPRASKRSIAELDDDDSEAGRNENAGQKKPKHKTREESSRPRLGEIAGNKRRQAACPQGDECELDTHSPKRQRRAFSSI
ncbi:hypothetical protein CPLU01_02327 [Colletotrichum plurivorum]|uniref:Uncharacterized protein n=1 Tax=Colletotrichum plurivorum TaxID=2175906 RepID=A0A8H6KW66_9PEZI|nr:hypothetical protein CPLU01_02327 [Colletotrichum plurivorum]